MKFVKYINTKIGKMKIVQEENYIIAIRVNEEIKIEQDEEEKSTELLEETANELEEYLQGKRKEFNIPINPKGTSFMKQVWKALCQIPYGEVRSYKQIAKQIENPNAVRAVGMANHKNPIPFIIPCHRVVGSNGKLVGYALGLDKKDFLLELERKNV